MNSSTCPECGATMKPGSTLCSACLLSSGNETLPLQPVSTGIPTLPCVFGGYRLIKNLVREEWASFMRQRKSPAADGSR